MISVRAVSSAAPSRPPVADPAAGPAIPVRRVRLDAAFDGLDRRLTDDLISSHVVAALSAVFPPGEDFFVRSVRRFRHRIADPELARAVQGFIGQEATHSRAHHACNARLAELGYPTVGVARLTDRLLRLRERIAPAKANLALTAAFEHVTATLAELLLTDAGTRQRLAAPALRALLCWHALEELEHKAVAFDVYRTVGGGETLRILTMKAARIGFATFIAASTLVSLRRDPAARRPGALRASWRTFRRSALVGPEVRRRLRDYERRGFHPLQRDTTALEAAWRARFDAGGGTLELREAGGPAV
jgi:predicted metal-dependent hydrolase